MASKKDMTAIDVTRDDQNNICTFGRMHRRAGVLNELIKKKKQDMENINDAADEIMIADSCKLVYGECFVTAEPDTEVTDILEERKAQIGNEITELEQEKENLDSLMKDLKGRLYAKFGSQIYLESE